MSRSTLIFIEKNSSKALELGWTSTPRSNSATFASKTKFAQVGWNRFPSQNSRDESDFQQQTGLSLSFWIPFSLWFLPYRSLRFVLDCGCRRSTWRRKHRNMCNRRDFLEGQPELHMFFQSESTHRENLLGKKRLTTCLYLYSNTIQTCWSFTVMKQQSLNPGDIASTYGNGTLPLDAFVWVEFMPHKKTLECLKLCIHTKLRK